MNLSKVPYAWIRKELAFDRAYRRGDKGTKVEIIQEWLSLREQHLKIDGDFGPATEFAVKRFQTSQRISDSGVVNKYTLDLLTAQMIRVLTILPAHSRTYGDLIMAYAKLHLAENPREIGGQNCGPWVRLYMQGYQGSDWPWCAGFVCFILRQAADTMKKSMPFKTTFSCDTLAAQAKEKGLLVSEKDLVSGKVAKNEIPLGSIFLNRRTDTDWDHTGLVVAFHEEVFETIEGNTNDAGDREGYEVCKRIRAYAGKDFIRIS